MPARFTQGRWRAVQAALGAFTGSWQRARAALPFTVPFNTSIYTGSIEALGDDDRAGAVAYWRLNEDQIQIGLAATGMWAGFGMNEKSPSMQGADFAVCREHQAGIVSAEDHFAKRNGMPELDREQDWVTLAGGRELYKPPEAPPGACIAGWTWTLNRCYKVGRAKNYAAAEKACVDEGAMLAVIEDAEENNAVAALAFDATDNRPFVWIGSRRANNAASWTNADGTATSYTNWHNNHPESKEHHDCALLGAWKSSTMDKKWVGSHCLWSEPGYVCERPLEPGTPVIDPNRFVPVLPLTWCEILRSRYTCNVLEDYQLRHLDIAITGLLAWAPPNQVSDIFQYHGGGSRRQQLFSFSGDAGIVGDAGLPSDAAEVVFHTPTHTVSSASGSFAYSYHKFEIDESKRYHVIRWRVALNRNSPAGKAGLQHHMDLRACEGPIPGATVGGTISQGQAMQYCQENFLVGSSTLPADEGIPIGSGGPVYLAIERHFYNPVGKSGLVDTGSKFHVTFTGQLRAKEMSSIHIGTLALKVPPNRLGFVMRSHCPPGCTEKMGTIKATRVSFHAHGHTRAAYLRQVRDGVELPPIAHIEPYDDSVGKRNINVEIRPGDELLLDCVYDNDLSKEIVYGDGIDDEMCWATLSVVGKNSVSKCHDRPDPAMNKWPTYDTDCKWCVENNKFDGACWQCNLAVPFAYCEGEGDPVGGRVDDSFERRGDPNAGLTAAVLKYQPYFSPAEGCDAQADTLELVPAIPGKCPAGGGAIRGTKECSFRWGGSMRVSWETDCTARRVRFELEKWGNAGWMAIGLHDAGSAASPRPLTPTRMNGADIVQVSVGRSVLKDGLGEDYKTPRAKNAAVAQLDEAVQEGSKMRATFSRPFDSAEGVGLSEDGFVWLLCAYRGQSDDFDAKHDQATALSSARISLFGGVAESYRAKSAGASSDAAWAGGTITPAPSPPGGTITLAPSPLGGVLANGTSELANGTASGAPFGAAASAAVWLAALALVVAAAGAA